MTIYNYKFPFDEFNYSRDNYCSSVDIENVFVRRVDHCIWECYEQVVACGDYDANCNYSRKTWCTWPLPEKLFNNFKKANYSFYNYLKQYKNYADYYNNTSVIYSKATSDGMCQIYSLLDNFNSYYGAVQDSTTITILSIGSCLGHFGNYCPDKLSEGFGIVINKITNDIHLITLGEDDGNYWGYYEVPYSNLSIYDRNEVIAIINNMPEECFSNKNELINKLWKS